MTLGREQVAPPVDYERIAAAVSEIIGALHLDGTREGLRDTPERVARMYADVFAGLRQDPREILETGFEEGHAEMVKVDGAADFPAAVTAIARAGIPVFAQFGITPQTSAQYGGWEQAGGPLPAPLREKLLRDARLLAQAGASLLDVTNAGEELSAELARAVSIPVLGGRGSGPGCDGHIQVATGL